MRMASVALSGIGQPAGATTAVGGTHWNSLSLPVWSQWLWDQKTVSMLSGENWAVSCCPPISAPWHRYRKGGCVRWFAPDRQPGAQGFEFSDIYTAIDTLPSMTPFRCSLLFLMPVMRGIIEVTIANGLAKNNIAG